LCNKMRDCWTNQLTKKRNRDQIPMHTQEKTCTAQANNILKGILLSITTLQHLLPIVYWPGMRNEVSVLLDHAVTLARLCAIFDPPDDVNWGCGVDCILIRYRLLLASCGAIAASALCNGLLSQDNSFDVCIDVTASFVPHISL
jgi:hypothetical protein